MERYELKHGASVIKTEDNIVPSENSVVFEVQAFKESGKYYTSFRLILEKYTKADIEKMQQSKSDSDRAFVYHIAADLADFLKNDRPFYQSMTLVVNCDSFFPMMIKAVSS